MHCGDCGFEYYFNMIAAVAALIYNDKGELLMTYRANDPAKGKLDLPGGFVDFGEDAASALKREIKEELDLEIVSSQYYASFPNEYLYGGMTYFTLDIIFKCEVASQESIKPADDVCGYTFLDPKGIPIERIGLQSIRNIIQRLKE